jgi:hypothetical protein
MIPTFSASRIGKLLKCGIAYNYEYNDGQPNPSNINMLLGVNTHNTAAFDLNCKITTERLADDDLIESMAADGIKNLIDATEIKLDEDERARGMDALKGEATDTAVTMTSAHHVELAPFLNPIKVNRGFEIIVPATISHHHEDIMLRGEIDLQEPTSLRDLKTTKKSPSEGDSDKSLQLTAYSFAATAIDKQSPGTVGNDYLVFGKRQTKVVRQHSRRTPQDHGAFVALLRAAVRQTESGIFLPAPDGAWWCSEGFCNFYEICAYGRKERVVL